MEHDAEYGAEFTETVYAHTSGGEVKLGSQTEYLVTVIVLMERNASCIIRKSLYLEYRIRQQSSFHCVTESVLYILLIFHSHPAFKLLSSGVSLGNDKASGRISNLTLCMCTLIWQPKLNSWDYQKMCGYLFHFCWRMTTLITSETDCQPDLTKIWRFRVVEELSQKDMLIGREMHSQKEKVQEDPSVCFTETTYRQRGGDNFQTSRKWQSILRNRPSWEAKWDLLFHLKQKYSLSFICTMHNNIPVLLYRKKKRQHSSILTGFLKKISFLNIYA